MAGINRLGKAAPKPGSLRPPDPNRRQDLDLFSEGAEQDADYMRMVNDIEDTQQNQSGWLFGRGAFDKGDLLYLRDEEEKRRFTEMELRDSERQQFMKARAKVEADRAAAALRAAQARKDKQARPAARPGFNIVRIKPSNQTSDQLPEPPDSNEPPDPKQPPAKKMKLTAHQGPDELEDLESPTVGTDQHRAPPPEAASLPSLLGNYGSDSEESSSDHDGRGDRDKG